MASQDVRIRPGRLKLASMLGMPSRQVKLYEKLETAVPVNAPLINPFRIIGGFGTHKFLFVFEIPPSSALDLFHGVPEVSSRSPMVYDFGGQVSVDYEFPMKFVLYRVGDSASLHFRSVLNNEKGIERVVPIIRDIKNSTLSVAIIDGNGKLLQAEKITCCQRGSKGGLCFRIKDFLDVEHLTSAQLTKFLTSCGSLLLRIEFVGSNLCPQAQRDSSNEGIAQYTLDSKFRNLLYQLVRDEEYNSFLRSWASNTKFANVKLRIQDKSKNVTILPAHRVLLAAQSDALGGYLRPREEVIVLEGLHHFTLLVMLDYIYSGEIHCNDLTTLVNLAEVGERLKVYGLKDKCIRDILMMFNNSVTNVKHIAACFKLGEILKSSALIDKAVECFRVMKHCDKCIDFPYAKALMTLAGSQTDEEFNKILNSLYEKSCPVKEDIRNLVQFPADEVKLVGTCSENWTGYLYVIPRDLCQIMATSSLSENGGARSDGSFSFLQKLETEEGFFELVRSDTNEINLRVTSTSDVQDNSSKEDQDLDRMLESLGISRTDYLSVIAESIGMTLKASLFDCEGRIISANLTRGILIDGNNYFWEVNSFITPKMLSSWDGVSEMLLRISFGAPQFHPTFRVMSSTDERYQHFKKFDMTFLKKVNTQPFTLRLLTQLELGTDSDAVVNVVDGQKASLLRSPVHAVILSAMSSQFEKSFTLAPTFEIGNYSVETVEMLLKFMYGEDIVPGHIGLVLELISAGEEFEVKGLKDKCIDKLCSCQLNMETCIHLYEIGSGTLSLPLKDIAVKFFRRNRGAVEKFQEFKDLVQRHPKILNLLNV